MRHYEIQGSLPSPEGKQWRTNVICHVVADDASMAMNLALQRHPDIDIWSLQHKGKVDIIQQGQ